MKDNMSYAWKILFSLMFVFITTFVVFPGAIFVERVSFMAPGSKIGEYKIIGFILVFNIFDTIGRKLAGKFHLNAKIIMIGALVRAIFIPSMIFLALKNNEDVPVFETDAFRLINLILFSVTNGYISTQCCIKAPSFVPKQ